MWSPLSVSRLVIFHWDPKSSGETKSVYRLVLNKCVKLVVKSYLGLRLELRAKTDVSRQKRKIQVIPHCQRVAFEVIQSLGTFRKASRSTRLKRDVCTMTQCP